MGAEEGDQDTGLFFPEDILQQIFTYHFLCTRQNGGANVIPYHHVGVGVGGLGEPLLQQVGDQPSKELLARREDSSLQSREQQGLPKRGMSAGKGRQAMTDGRQLSDLSRVC